MSEEDVTAKRLSENELRRRLAHATDRIQKLRRDDAESRDRFEKNSVGWSSWDGRVRAYSQSLDVLFAWTDGEFGENYDPMGGDR